MQRKQNSNTVCAVGGRAFNFLHPPLSPPDFTLSKGSLIWIKKVKHDTFALNRLSHQTVKWSIAGIWFFIGIHSLLCLHKAAPLIKVTSTHIKGKKEAFECSHTFPKGVSSFPIPFSVLLNCGTLKPCLTHQTSPVWWVIGAFFPFKRLAGNALSWTLWEVC